MPATRPVVSLLAAAACAALVVAASATVSASAGAHVRQAPAPGVISVVAGGAGGPGIATTVALANTNVQTRNCGVTYGDGNLYIGDGPPAARSTRATTGSPRRPGSAPRGRSATPARRPARPCWGRAGSCSITRAAWSSRTVAKTRCAWWPGRQAPSTGRQ